MTIDTSPEALARLRETLRAVGGWFDEAARQSVSCSEVADVIAALEAERDAAFKMSRCECASDEACRNLAQAWAERDAAQSLADHMTELWNEAERERDAALAALREIAGNSCCDGCQEAKRVAQAALAGENHVAQATLTGVNPAMAAAIDEVTK